LSWLTENFYHTFSYVDLEGGGEKGLGRRNFSQNKENRNSATTVIKAYFA
jgi:hypothetical protein